MTDDMYEAVAKRIAGQTEKLASDLHAQADRAAEQLLADQHSFAELLTNEQPRPATTGQP